MVNVPGRSRGCANCRRRKVKCDQSFPECLRCVDMGLRCPGARTEAFFVHAVPDAPVSDSTVSSIVISRPQGVGVLDGHRQWQLPAPPPSRASAFDQLFVSHFIDSFFGPTKPPAVPGLTSTTWLDELPRFLATPGPCLAKNSIRATAMLSYGTMAHDPSIQTEAYRWYIRALQDVRCLLSKGTISFDESAVCATVMLLHFETGAGTRRKAWLQHVKGAAMMVEGLGPEHCRSGFLHQIFSHIRLQTFVAAMVENELHAFASPEWMTIPFEIYPKGNFDMLVDNLFSVQRCLSVANRLIKSTGEKGRDLKVKLSTLVLDSMSQLYDWWTQCKSIGSTSEAARRNLEPGNGTIANLAYDPNDFPILPYADIPSAALTSLYDAANVVIFRLNLLVSDSTTLYSQRVRRHAQSILDANEFTTAQSDPTPDRGSIMMVLQLKIVSLWSPSLDQREVATRMLQKATVQNGGFADISEDSDEYFADVAGHILYKYPGE